MQEIEVLKRFGLSEKEARVYILLLELGSSKAGVIMEKLSLYSKTAYEIINKLIGKGLVGYNLKGNIKYYNAVDPEKFLGLIQEKQENLVNTKNDLIKILPALKQKKEFSEEEQEVNTFVGKKAMKSIFNDSLKENNEILIFGGGGKFKESLGPYSELWHKQRVKKNIKVKLLWSQELRKKKSYLKNYKYLEVKFLPKEFDNPAPAIIYNNKVAITIWTERPIATLIKSKEVAESYRSYFNLLWKIAKP